jgi:hypothetical protein
LEGKAKIKMYPSEITFHYLTGQAMQNCGGPSDRIIFEGNDGSIMSDIAQLWSKYGQKGYKKRQKRTKKCFFVHSNLI